MTTRKTATPIGTVSGGLALIRTENEFLALVRATGFKTSTEFECCYDQKSQDNSGMARIRVEAGACFDIYRFDRFGCTEWEVRNIRYRDLPKSMVAAIILESAGSLA